MSINANLTFINSTEPVTTPVKLINATPEDVRYALMECPCSPGGIKASQISKLKTLGLADWRVILPYVSLVFHVTSATHVVEGARLDVCVHLNADRDVMLYERHPTLHAPLFAEILGPPESRDGSVVTGASSYAAQKFAFEDMMDGYHADDIKPLLAGIERAQDGIHFTARGVEHFTELLTERLKSPEFDDRILITDSSMVPHSDEAEMDDHKAGALATARMGRKVLVRSGRGLAARGGYAPSMRECSTMDPNTKYILMTLGNDWTGCTTLAAVREAVSNAAPQIFARYDVRLLYAADFE